MRRSKLKGSRKLRRIFKKLPRTATEEVREEIASGANEILLAARFLVPSDTGQLRDQLKAKVSRDGLSAKIGILGKRGRRDGFHGVFLEFGTKERQHRKTGKSVGDLPAQPFLFPAFEVNRRPIIKKLEGATSRALRKAVVG